MKQEVSLLESSFQEWCRREENSIHIHTNLSLFAQGPLDRCVRSTSEIHQTELLVSIPPSAYLHYKSDDPFFVSLSEISPSSSSISPTFSLALRLLHEKSLGSKSNFYAYLNILPEKFTNGDNFTKEVIEALSGTSLGPLLHSSTDYSPLHQTFDRFILPLLTSSTKLFPDPSYQNFPAFLWAVSVIKTRGFFSPNGDGPYLLPVLDLFNHRTDPPSDSSSATHHPDTRPQLLGQNFELRAEQPIPAGREVFSCYGKLSNAELLFTYGFVEEETPYDGVFLSAQTIICGAENRGIPKKRSELRFEKLKEIGVQSSTGVTLSREDLIPGELLTIMQVMMMEDEEFEMFVESPVELDDLEEDDAEYVLSVYALIVAVAQAKLKEYKTNLKEDMKSLAQGKLEKMMRDAVVIACNEKQMLYSIIAQMKEEASRLAKEVDDESEEERMPKKRVREPETKKNKGKKKKNKK
eukprot:TRINITY_DN6421_c0_g1_i1.p1 TRINITY_DN6421_c0_g1~~TRINITY_DN6421_c0_g1_i1.p1  ORF type:complete len:466 (+),score=121.97 TRINITY_DN6421_c0_g1_i1:32-1429(+)